MIFASEKAALRAAKDWCNRNGGGSITRVTQQRRNIIHGMVTAARMIPGTRAEHSMNFEYEMDDGNPIDFPVYGV